MDAEPERITKLMIIADPDVFYVELEKHDVIRKEPVTKTLQHSITTQCTDRFDAVAQEVGAFIYWCAGLVRRCHHRRQHCSCGQWHP